jgi:hypothetical protein
MGVINMLTDTALILFPMHVIVTLQMSTGKKLTILVFFSARLLYVQLSAHYIEPTDTSAGTSLPQASRSPIRSPSLLLTRREICGSGRSPPRSSNA